MKVSYKVLKKYLPELPEAEEVAKKLIMHTAEVEELIHEGNNLKDVIIGEVVECEKHPDADTLNATTVNLGDRTVSVVCGAPNARKGIKVACAVVGAQLKEDFTIAKTKIRGVLSEGMLCSLDELSLTDVRQEGILELPEDAPIGTTMKDYLGKNDIVLEVDNKAINHRPDMFSHMGVIRELATLYNLENPTAFSENDFSNLPKVEIENEIPEVVNRYSALRVENVKNVETPDYIKQVLDANEVTSKGLLVDMTNYSLYFYGQPTHAFDADKINGKITIRYAKDGEEFVALDDSEHKLTSQDIVIADEEKVLALGGVIGGKSSSVTDETTNIVLESAHFDQAVIRHTGRRCGIRTDSLNVFEKNIAPDLQDKASSLILEILKENISTAKETAYSDLYAEKQEKMTVPYDLPFTNKIIGKEYTDEEAKDILAKLGFELDGNDIKVPFWRTDIRFKADIAEEIARVHGFDNIESTISTINTGAVSQAPMYRLKKETSHFFVDRGFYEMYNYSFVGKALVEKINDTLEGYLPLKNFLSEDATHMRASLVPSLLNSLEENIRDEKEMKMFELEKVYPYVNGEIEERYRLASVITETGKDVLYYEMQNELSDYFNKIGVSGVSFKNTENTPSYAHKGRTAEVILRNKVIGYVGEIHPSIAARFDVKQRVAFFEVNMDKVAEAAFGIVKAKEFSIFQENNFDMSFLVDKDFEGRKLHTLIENVDRNHIVKVDLIDIYENEEKLPGKRSLAFKVYINSLDGTLDDSFKAKLIETIKEKSNKIGADLRTA